MKKVIQILAIVLIIMVPMIIAAQPQPWDPGIGGGAGGNSVGGGPGGGAPIGGGLLIMLSLAIGYGAKKIYNARKKVLD